MAASVRIPSCFSPGPLNSFGKRLKWVMVPEDPGSFLINIEIYCSKMFYILFQDVLVTLVNMNSSQRLILKSCACLYPSFLWMFPSGL